MDRKIVFSLSVTVTIAITGALLFTIFTTMVNFGEAKFVETSRPKAKAAEGTIIFNPPSPGEAPPEIRDAVMLGYDILMNTQKYASKHVGNKLNCKSCHFGGGMTAGGKNGGLSLVGVGATYPKFRKRQGYAVDLIARTNDCFERSMNGNPLPADSKEMIAIVTYYQWISKGLPIYAQIPWLGLESLKSDHKPDPTNGGQILVFKCSVCHGKEAQGTEIAPPLWGPESFNDGAGMYKLETFAAFCHANMPFSNPDLTVEQALDVAAHVISQPRPHFMLKAQ